MESRIEVKPSETQALKIQASIRGYLARKRFSVRQLTQENLEDYNVLISGNDPLTIPELPNHTENEVIALIATSGMRCVEIACQLSKGVPKLIIIDNSRQVIAFWRKARDIMEQAEDKENFLEKIKKYIETTQCNRIELTTSDFSYLEKIFNTFDFSQLKNIIANATIIAQSWADKNTMIKLKNILAHHKINTIYAYPSNIATYLNIEVNSKEAKKVLESIQELNPTKAFHTDYRPTLGGRIPKQFFTISNHLPSKVARTLEIEKPTPEEIKLENERLIREFFS